MARILTTLICSFLIGCTFLSAIEETPTYSMNFRVFGVGNDMYKNLHYYDGQSYSPLAFHKVSRSLVTYSYRGSPYFGIFIKNPEYDPRVLESNEYLQISSILLTQNLELGLLIFHAHPSNKDSATETRRFELHLIDDSTDHFPRNSIVLVNATGADLLGKIGADSISLPRGISEPIPYPGAPRGKITRLTFALQTKVGFRLVMSNDILLSNNRRIVMILMPPRKANSMRIDTRKLSQSIFVAEE